ncbi:MAG TPA: TIR domain-containing protein [Caulobacteraceae bacterium]|nr:TIR domain-containing protein [Caulobacteraceae bacterium]
MSEVFISYARSNLKQARVIEQALKSVGFQVWRDDALPANRPFSEVIEERLRMAKAVLVIWSAPAARSQWVRSEADRARIDDKLVQATIDNSPLPMPFDQIHCANLSGWSVGSDSHEWRTVISSLDDLIQRASAAPARRALVEADPNSIASPGSRPSLPLPGKPSIAVLPFKNLSDEARQEYFADGVTEDIVTALSRWRWFLVIARHSSFSYRDRSVDVVRVGEELGVRYILDGSVRMTANKVRVTAQLIDAASGSHIWADRFDREPVDLLALQDEITAQVAAAIEPAIVEIEGARVARTSLADFTALDCFYKGMWNLNSFSEKSDAAALALFREAIERDPGLALAHAGVARALYGRAVFGSTSDPIRALKAARRAARRAVELDPHDSYGYFAAAGASLYLGEHDAALDEATRAVTLNPNLAYAHYRLGQVLIFSGRPAEAIVPIERTLRLSPYDPQLGPILETLALAHYHVGAYAEAVENSRAASRISGAGSAVLAASLARQQRAEEAAQAFARVRGARPSRQQPLAAPYAHRSLSDGLREGFRLAAALPAR